MAKLSKGAELRAEQAIQAALAQADACVALEDGDGVAAQKDLLSVLRAADKSLAARILKITPKPSGEMRFSAAQAIAYQAQIQMVIAHVQFKLDPIATEAGNAAINKSLKSGAKLLAKLEQEFKGVTLSPSLLAVIQQSQVARGPKASLVTRVATSVDRYGLEMGRQFSRIIQVGLASGASSEQMVASLVAHGGPKGIVSLAAKEVAPGIVQRLKEGDIPEGLFVRHKYWAERLIRTETAYAYNGAKLAQLYRMRAEGMDDVHKKICAHFDNRTAPDSIAVHGQVRALEDTFVDGAGRVYLQPPARPNDRETLVPWFDDWKELPSTEPPTASEQAEATELATSDTLGQGDQPPAVPKSTLELQQLEDRARSLHEDPSQTQALRVQLELAHEDEASKHAETLAHEALERLRKQKLEQARTLEQALAKQKADEEAATDKAAKKAAAAISKENKGVLEHVKEGNGHLAALDLYELAASKPKVFAGLIQTHGAFSIPELSITGSLEFPEVLDNFVSQTLEQGYGKHDPLGDMPVQNQLLEFKKFPGFVGWLDELASKGDSQSKKQLAALIASEGVPLTKAAALLKKPSALVVQLAKIKDKYHPPVAPKVTYTIKEEAGYQDVYGADGVKLGYFKKSPAGKFTVNPPAGLLEKFPARTFADDQEAAAYAVVVSNEIKKTPKVPAKAATPYAKASGGKWAERDPSTITSVIGPLKLDPKAAKEIAGHKKKAAAHFDALGVNLRRTYNGTDEEHTLSGVDQVLKREGLLHQADKWSGNFSGCWYSASTGAKAQAGVLLAKDNKGPKDAKGMVEQLDPDGDEKKYFEHTRVKYAATQAALEHRIKKGEELEVDADGYVILYRGINGAQASALKKAREQAETTKVELRGVSSWSIARSVANGFAGASGVVVRARVHVSRIYSQFEQERIAYYRFKNEREWIVVAEDLEHEVDSSDIENYTY